ncbi:MAG: AraC family transcriptional regulator [Chitinophagaceae bacterium]|nr:AraC family transcriptional regulator [Chitinophagaceae bacterium]
MKKADRKQQGFTGERIIDIPRSTLIKCGSMPLIQQFHILRIGFFPKARHHYYQRPTGSPDSILIYCTDGQGWIQLPGRRIIVQAGSVFVISPGTSHSYSADPDNPWTIYWFHFTGKHCADAVKVVMGTSNPVQALVVPYSSERIALFERIYNTFLKGYSISNLLFANLTVSYFLASFALPESFQQKEERADTPTTRAIQFMQDHLNETVTLDIIAKAAQLSTSFFSRRFKLDTGYAPIEYYNHLRIQKACQLLHSGELRINEIALHLGIDDPFYFSRLFKKQLGVSPAQYRQKRGASNTI